MCSKKIIGIYATAAVICLAVLSALAFKARSPIHALVGTWREVSWQYDNAGRSAPGGKPFMALCEEVKSLTGQDLVIHASESWEFRRDGTLRLCVAGREKFMRWKLKGRGHILQLSDGTSQEHYNIIGLNHERLVINYDTDMEVRGIAKLTFLKNNSH